MKLNPVLYVVCPAAGAFRVENPSIEHDLAAEKKSLLLSRKPNFDISESKVTIQFGVFTFQLGREREAWLTEDGEGLHILLTDEEAAQFLALGQAI